MIFPLMLSQSLVEVIKGFESLMEEMKEIQRNVNFFGGVQMTSLSVAGSSRRASSDPTSSGKHKFVLLDVDIMNQIKEQLTSVESRLKIIPIVGMGGIGKTTLAKALIDDSLTSSHFDVRGWVTVSQQYSIKDVVENLLNDITGKYLKNEKLIQSSEQLHKTLFGRRYVIVLDDLWDTEACNELLNLFPECNNRSRVMVTTRQSGVATFAAKSYHEMKFLNDDTSWDLLCQEIFPQEGNKNCPTELMEIGKEIAMKCNGLPLTISVIGGLLSKGEMTQQHWEYVAENMKLVLTKEGDWCSEILSLSYNHLPHRLKPCFLYLGIYPEDDRILVSELLQFWVVEGFLKPGLLTDMEEVAEENLKDLIKRNLILVHKVTDEGKPEYCKIHDLLRDLCIREARKEKFFHVWNEQTEFNHEETKGCRRLSILPLYAKEKGEYDMKNSMPGIRSLMCFADDYVFESNGNELLRILKHHRCRGDSDLIYERSELSNLRWIKLERLTNKIADSVFNMWDLQYLIIGGSVDKLDLPLSIWCMPQLRHLMMVEGSPSLPLFPPNIKRPCVLNRLEALTAGIRASGIFNFRCDDEVLVRIPNLRKLKIIYSDDGEEEMDWSYYLLNNLVNMFNLQILHCRFYVDAEKGIPVEHISFPISLKQLTLCGSCISWEHIDQIIGVLPNLEFLELIDPFGGPTWITSEDHFKKLEFLTIYECDLKEWIVEDSNHFPSLRRLFIRCCEELEEIPTCIGEIPTLETIELLMCSAKLVSSAKSIQDDYNNDIKLIINRKAPHVYEEDDE